ncbi:FHA domain-containing protein [Cystobacter fuscus]|uniref:FHA domain-containing protein n=1 Tax=Cystobacter fuscus TaxID=43 RepID=A0A250JBN5_9BACT|nr:FHA domain-containing protein [Cystobacter fuscus]
MPGRLTVDLERTSGHLGLDFQRDIQFKATERAAPVPGEINRSFPPGAHRCHNRPQKAIEHGP